MVNRKFVVQIIGIIVGLIFFMLGMLSPLSTIIFCGIGVGLINFNIIVSSFRNIDYRSLNFIFPLVLMILGIILVFFGLLASVSIVTYGSVGMISIITSIILMLRTNQVE